MRENIDKMSGVPIMALILAAASLLLLPGFGCQSAAEGGSGTIKLLFTSEVGGRLDPCG